VGNTGQRIAFDGSIPGTESRLRTSQNTWCDGPCLTDSYVQGVVARIENLTGVHRENYENLQLLRYSEGQFYETHHDYISHQRDIIPGPRMLTVFLYLNNVEEGGATEFTELSLTVKPKKGMALIWPSVHDQAPLDKDGMTSHRAQVVEKGIKYGANVWIHQRNIKKALENNCM